MSKVYLWLFMIILQRLIKSCKIHILLTIYIDIGERRVWQWTGFWFLCWGTCYLALSIVFYVHMWRACVDIETSFHPRAKRTSNRKEKTSPSKFSFHILVRLKCLFPFPSAAIFPTQKSHFFSQVMLWVNPRWFTFNIAAIAAFLSFDSKFVKKTFVHDFLFPSNKFYFYLREKFPSWIFLMRIYVCSFALKINQESLFATVSLMAFVCNQRKPARWQTV